MSSLNNNNNNTTNRIPSSSITPSNHTYAQSVSFNNSIPNRGNDGDGSASSSSGTATTATLDLAAMGLAAASLAAVTGNTTSHSNNTDGDLKRNMPSATPFKLHATTPDDLYGGFYGLNRTLPPPPSNASSRTSPFNMMNSSPNNNLQFMSNSTGE